ncbi:TetR/AcrR family transcriptional regulator [Modicisalibacter zincidurans]|uniref:TetR/AcrR family transcriptional regulator n=1 Tax=Modicisalibacter zincidurans TaxID=1178777 RepID=A0ABP9RH41_9GAMM|nr:TetR/AcrR family transcriptional regulator [Halomonas zincidurans]
MKSDRPTTNRIAWIDAAYDLLIDAGVGAVKIVPLAKKLGASRTSFYWLFKEREEVLDALLERWERRNTYALVLQTEKYASSIVEAMLNVFDCWFDPALFDSEFEYAVRSWSLQDRAVAGRVRRADEQRLQALQAMFIRYGYDSAEADTRARTVYLIQIGYISMHTQETRDTRISRVAQYVAIFTGQPCVPADLERFAARHTARFSGEELAAAQRQMAQEPAIDAGTHRG